MIVMKFGGTSLEDAASIERVCGIVAARSERNPLVVVSAMGKTTDRLVEMARLAAGGDLKGAEGKLAGIAEHHLRESAAVVPPGDRENIREFLEGHFDHIRDVIRGLAIVGELTPRSMDLILSFGERLSSVVVSHALRNKGLSGVSVDSRSVVLTDGTHNAANVLPEQTAAALGKDVAPLVAEGSTVVMGGFIAGTLEGVTTTLGRGGSDYTASLVGAMLGADEVQIWTDVDGVMTADPSMIADAHRLKIMSFAEAAELAYFGARVLHPATMAPAVEKSIPIRVLNSRRPDNDGTLIVTEPSARSIVKSIAYKEGITVVDIRSTRMLMAHGFLARIFEVFEKHQTSVDMVTTSEVSVSLTVDRAERLDAILGELSAVAEVERRDGQVIVCVVGDGIRYTPGVSAKIFSALDGVFIEMISLGASRLNVSFVVDEKDLEEVVGRLHSTFFTEVDGAIFA